MGADAWTIVGTIAALVAAVAALGAFRPWLNVRRHNRLALEEYEDLVTWARDDLQAEAAELDRVRAELAARGMLPSGELGYGLGRVRDQYAQRWRDRSRGGERAIAELHDAEGWSEGAWRWVTRQPWPANPHAEEVDRITRAWADDEVRREAVLREVAMIQGQ